MISFTLWFKNCTLWELVQIGIFLITFFKFLICSYLWWRQNQSFVYHKIIVFFYHISWDIFKLNFVIENFKSIRWEYSYLEEKTHKTLCTAVSLMFITWSRSWQTFKAYTLKNIFPIFKGWKIILFDEKE